MNEKIEQLEAERKVIYAKFLKIVSISVIIMIFALLIAVITSVFPLMFVGFIIGGIIISNEYKMVKVFSNSFKTIVVQELITAELDNATYNHNKGLTVNEIMYPNFFRSPDRYHSEDLLSAEYENIKFDAADIVLEEKHVRTDSKGHTHTEYVTYFRGRFFIFDFKRDLNLVVKCLETLGLGANNKRLEKVETESIAFNKKFKSFASTAHDAFYILTPTLQEKMMELEKMFSGTIFFAFMNGKFYLAINDNSNSFDLRISKPIDENLIKKVINEIRIAPAIIEEFNLKSDKFKNNI